MILYHTVASSSDDMPISFSWQSSLYYIIGSYSHLLYGQPRAQFQDIASNFATHNYGFLTCAFLLPLVEISYILRLLAAVTDILPPEILADFSPIFRAPQLPRHCMFSWRHLFRLNIHNVIDFFDAGLPSFAHARGTALSLSSLHRNYLLALTIIIETRSALHIFCTVRQYSWSMILSAICNNTAFEGLIDCHYHWYYWSFFIIISFTISVAYCFDTFHTCAATGDYSVYTYRITREDGY